ncbi:MAG TPA: hypothetical protein GX518_05555 [Firmicutes bacterium]|nr:hypothetical protein [Bacillota bacterium]
MYWYNGPGYPMYPGNPGGPYYPAFPGAGWQLDYDSIEGHLWSYYPSLYHEVYPVVERVLNERDDPWRYPVPPRTMVEEMVAEVERRWQWSGEGGEGAAEVETQQRRLLRAFIFVILLDELLRRRRRIFR